MQRRRRSHKAGIEEIGELIMPEELKDLIEKIQTEGIKAAESKALEIESEAQKRASQIVDKAEKEASGMISEAKDQIKRLEDGARSSLKQASRDMMISLKKELAAILEKIVAKDIHKALSPEEMARIISNMIKAGSGQDKTAIVVTLKKEDIEKMEKAVMGELSHEIKKGVTLKPGTDIQGGFHISYDSGKSYFDFSDKAMAEYISTQLKPALGDIIKEAALKQ